MKEIQRDFAGRIDELRSWTTDLSSSVLDSGGTGIERDKLTRAAITILLAGAFEDHLKRLVRSFIESVNRWNIPFEQLPAPIQRGHLEDGADFIRKTATRERKEFKGTQESPPYIETQRLSVQLASAADGQRSELIWEAFADTQANPGPEVVGSILKRLDTQKPWPTIAQNAPNPYPQPGTAEPTDRGRLEGLLVSELRNLITARNRCAHGALETAPAPSTLHEYMNAVDAISEGILATLESQLREIQPDAL